MAGDDYETKYMGGGDALARSKAGMPWWFHLLMAFAIATIVGTSVAHATFVGLAGLPVLLLTWVLFMFLRVTVTPETVHVQLGLFGPKIAVADILEVSAEAYPFMKYGGWGIRLGLDGSIAYSVPGHGGRGVKIRYKKKSGREATVFVTSPDPEAIVAAIGQARAGRGANLPRVAAGRVRVEPNAAASEAPVDDEREDADGTEGKRARAPH
jgi:hypothetical protein